MARGKNARALFEVIKQANEQQTRRTEQLRRKAGAGSRPSLFGWLTGGRERVRSLELPPSRDHAEPEAAVSARPVGPPDVVEAEADTRTPAATTGRESLHDTAIAMAAIDATAPEPQVEAASRAADADDADAETTAPDREEWSDDGPEEAGASPSAPMIDVHASSAEPAPRRAAVPKPTLQFALSYPSAAVAAVAAVLLLTVAFLAGRHTARPAFTGPTLSQLQAQKPAPDVLNLGGSQPRPTVTPPADSAADAGRAPRTPVTPPTDRREAANEPLVVAPSGPAPAEPAAAGTASGDRRRVIGRHYIIAQSYPDPEGAEKAADLLRKNNIPVTVEQLDYAPGWYCVVTEVGFDRHRSDEYQRYEKLIRDLNAQVTAARMKRFDPYPYKWK